MGNACQGRSNAAAVETSHFAAADDRNKNNTPNSGGTNDKPPPNLSKNKQEIEFSISGTGVAQTSTTEKERTLSTKNNSSLDFPAIPPPKVESESTNALSTENLKDSRDKQTENAREKSNEEGATKSEEPTEPNNDMPTTNSRTKDDIHDNDEDDIKKLRKTTKEQQQNGSVVIESSKDTNELQEGYSDQVDVMNVPQVAMDEVNLGSNTADCESTMNIQSFQVEIATDQVMSSEGISKSDNVAKNESTQSLEVKNDAMEIKHSNSILLQNSNRGSSLEPEKDSVQIDADGIDNGKNPNKSVNKDSTAVDAEESDKKNASLASDPSPVPTNNGQDPEEKEDSAIGTPKNQSSCQTVVEESTTKNPSNLNTTQEKPPPGDNISVDKLSQISSSARNNINISSKDDKRSAQLRKIQKSQTMNVINYPNGDIYKGDTDEDNKPHGNGKMTYADGSNYQGAWVHGMRQGLGKVLFPDGSFYKGDFNANMFHGQGVMFWADGAYYSGEWVKNQQHGQGKEVYPGGKKLRHKGLWKNGWPVREESNQVKDVKSDDQSDLEETIVARDAKQESS